MNFLNVWGQVIHVVIRVKLIFVHKWASSFRGWAPSLCGETFVVLRPMDQNHNKTFLSSDFMDKSTNIKKARQLISSNQRITQCDTDFPYLGLCPIDHHPVSISQGSLSYQLRTK